MLPVLLLLSACKNGSVFSEKIPLVAENWAIDDNISFQFEINEIEKSYNVFIELDIYDDFLTNNLWLFISTESPSGINQTDTVMFYVADLKGKWYGRKKGKIVSNKFLYKSMIKFPEKGQYGLRIRHGMRENDLPKVESIGIEIEIPKSDNDR
jgi:gliding motility-associated lipoprotein GldH